MVGADAHASVDLLEGGDRGRAHPHALRLEHLDVFVGEHLPDGEHGDVADDPSQQADEVRGPRCGAEDGDRSSRVLVSVAERAAERECAPQVLQAGDVGKVVGDARGEDDLAPLDHGAVGDADDEGILGARDAHRCGVADLHVVVGGELCPCGRAELGGGGAVRADHVVHVQDGAVAVLARVEEQRGAVHPPEGQSGLQSCRSCADHDGVVHGGPSDDVVAFLVSL